jgi:hypothetical protein
VKYFYTPSDLAVYFLISDFAVSDERQIINFLWERQQSAILPEYRTSIRFFRNSVYNKISEYDCTLDEIDELNLLMQDMDYSFTDEDFIEQGIIESFFKIIRLQLTYTPNKEYRKIKLRTLIGRFGYKRRSAILIDYIDEALKTLGLVTYLRGYVPCNIAEIKLDDTVIIRLKQ